MIRKLISALLAGTLCVLPVLPAGAAGETPPAAQEEQAVDPTAVTVRKMGMRAVRAAVEEGSPTAQVLRKTAASMDPGSISGATGGSSEAEALQGLIESMTAAMEKSGNPEDSLYKTYEAQIKVLQIQLEGLQQSASSAMQGMTALLQLEDAAYQLRRQADNVAGQLAQTAQTLLITIQSLQYNKAQIERQIAALDRTIAVAEVQLSIGTISQLQMDTYHNQRDNLARSLETLDVQCENLGSSIALLCGYGADTMVVPSTIPEVYDADLRQMDYDADLEQALDNSFSIWQSRNELRQAQNARDEDIPATVTAVQAAQEALEAEQDTVRAAFDTLYQNVQDSVQARDAAQTAAAQAELDFRTSTVQYDNGMISRLAYQQAQDTLADARLAVESAQLSLRSAYTQYEWALEGVMTSAAETA